MRRFPITAIAAFLLAWPVAQSAGQSTSELPHFRTSASARSWAEREEAKGEYQLAGLAYLEESIMRAMQGDPQAAEVERRRAERLLTDLDLAIAAPAVPPAYSLAKLEPANGCYLGVLDENPDGHLGNADNMEQRLGRPVGVAYIYQTYGDPFPWDWARGQAARGRLIQIAWEPQQGLGDVRDDDYLNNWAEAAADCGTGVFLRFAGEMNGDWTAWGRSPDAYRRAFRLVHAVIDRHAENVALVWAPNDVPVAQVDSYYPGDDVVDWVGISLYIVRYYDNDLNNPGWQDHPDTFIAPFYNRYAGRKPICLVECGVTRRSQVDNKDADAFAAVRIEDLMDAVRVRYPRLKMLCWFDRNNLTGGQAGRRFNDYSMPLGSLALSALRTAAADPYFLGRASQNSPVSYRRVDRAMPKQYAGALLASLSTYDLDAELVVTRAGNQERIPRPFRFFIPAGSGPVAVQVQDSRGHVAEAENVAGP
jgi:hypothetical protein